jgi:hypothetical protein
VRVGADTFLELADTSAPSAEGDSVADFNEWKVCGPPDRSHPRERQLDGSVKVREKSEDMVRRRDAQH